MDTRVVQCNYRIGTSVCGAGARAYLTSCVDSTKGRVLIVARSRSGRWVLRWEGLKRLHNFRLRTLAADDPLVSKIEIARDYWSQAVVDNLNSAAMDVG